MELEKLKMNLLLIFCALFFVADGYQFRYDYKYNQDANGWLKLHRIPTTWTEARLRCFREGAELASPENNELYAAMKGFIGQDKAIYTGIHATHSTDYFYSIGGKPLSRMPLDWVEGDLNTNNGAACIYMTLDRISATNCSEMHSYICYRKKTLATVLTECGTFDKDYVLKIHTGKCYKFHTEPQKWSDAFATCSGEGGHLAIINSDTEAEVIKELFEKHPPSSMPGNYIKDIAHVGYRDWSDHGLWMTIHGQTLKEAGYEKWGPKDPHNRGSGGQHCGGIFTSGKLNDLWCEGTYPFICEKDRDSLLK